MASRPIDGAKLSSALRQSIGCAGFSWRRRPLHQYYHECFLVVKDGEAHKSVSGCLGHVLIADDWCDPVAASP